MPEKQLDFWIWLWAVLTGPDIKAAFWAGVGGLMRVYVMHKEGARITLIDVAGTMLLAVGWGVALADNIGLLLGSGIEEWLGWSLPATSNFLVAGQIIAGISGAAITMGIIDFGADLRARLRGKS